MKTLFILNARNQSQIQDFLLQGVLDLAKHRTEPVFFLQGKNKDLEKKLSSFQTHIWADDAYIMPENGKTRALLRSFQKAVYVLTSLKRVQPDVVLSCDMTLLTLLAPFCYMTKIPLLWVQETPWQKDYRAGALLGGYAPSVLTTSEEIYDTLPPFLRQKARVLPALCEKISAKSYVENVFKGCI